MGGALGDSETIQSQVVTAGRSDSPGASATGDTLRDVPMIKTRSTCSLSSSSVRSKSSANFSPKNVMSGYTGKQEGLVSRATCRVTGGKEDLHNPRRVLWKVGFVFLTLIIIPPTALPLFLTRLESSLRRLRIVASISRITNLAQRYPTGQYLLLDLGTDHFPTTLNARRGGERSVALEDALHSCSGLERINVLGIVLFMIVVERARRERARQYTLL